MHIMGSLGHWRVDEQRGAAEAARLLAERAGKDGGKEKPDAASAKPAAPAVTGVTRAALAPETLGAAQKAQEGGDMLKDWDGSYASLSKKVLERFPMMTELRFRGLAHYASEPDSPEFKRRLKVLAYGHYAPFYRGTPGILGKRTPEALAEMKHSEEFVKRALPMALAVGKEKVAFYEKMKAAGVPPLERMQKLLEFDAGLPASFGDGIFSAAPGQKPPLAPGGLKQIYETELDAFKMARAAYGAQPQQKDAGAGEAAEKALKEALKKASQIVETAQSAGQKPLLAFGEPTAEADLASFKEAVEAYKTKPKRQVEQAVEEALEKVVEKASPDDRDADGAAERSRKAA